MALRLVWTRSADEAGGASRPARQAIAIHAGRVLHTRRDGATRTTATTLAGEPAGEVGGAPVGELSGLLLFAESVAGAPLRTLSAHDPTDLREVWREELWAPDRPLLAEAGALWMLGDGVVRRLWLPDASSGTRPEHEAALELRLGEGARLVGASRHLCGLDDGLGGGHVLSSDGELLWSGPALSALDADGWVAVDADGVTAHDADGRTRWRVAGRFAYAACSSSVVIAARAAERSLLALDRYDGARLRAVRGACPRGTVALTGADVHLGGRGVRTSWAAGAASRLAVGGAVARLISEGADVFGATTRGGLFRATVERGGAEEPAEVVSAWLRRASDLTQRIGEEPREGARHYAARYRLLKRVGALEDRAVGPLVDALEGAEPTLRAEAARSLRRLGPDASRPAMEALARALHDEDEAVREQATETLAALDEARAREEVLGLPIALIAPRAALPLLERAGSGGLPVLEHLATRPDRRVREAAFGIAGRLDGPRHRAHLVRLLETAEPEVRVHAAERLSRLGAREAVAPIARGLDEADPFVRRATVTALGRLGDGEMLGPVLARSLDASPSVRVVVPRAVSRLQSPPSLGLVAAGFHDVERDVRRATLHALLEIPGVPPFADRHRLRIECLIGGAPDRYARFAAAEAHVDFGWHPVEFLLRALRREGGTEAEPLDDATFPYAPDPQREARDGIPELVAALQHPSPALRMRVRRVLDHLQPPS